MARPIAREVFRWVRQVSKFWTPVASHQHLLDAVVGFKRPAERPALLQIIGQDLLEVPDHLCVRARQRLLRPLIGRSRSGARRGDVVGRR